MLTSLVPYPLRPKQLSPPLKSLPFPRHQNTNILRVKSVLRPPHPFVCILSVIFVLCLQDGIVATGIVWPTESKIFTYCLAIYRKGFLTLALEYYSTWDTVTLSLGLPYPPDCEQLEERCGPFLNSFLCF